MDIAVITGSCGLIGSESVRHFARLGMTVVGVDNDMRKYFFGAEASTDWNRTRLEEQIPSYVHKSVDIRDYTAIEKIFDEYGTDIKLVIHAAAQPSHDWAAGEVFTDFSVNANGTLNLLEACRQKCPEAVFIFASTNKVYGDAPNTLPLVELETRWELDDSHPYYERGIDESMSVDQTKHSLFGVSKLAADALTQEYGRYFGMRTVSLRGGCLTGPAHSGAKLHGFLSYLVKCVITGNKYTVYGYKGKQVRDNIHSADFVEALGYIYKDPRPGEVYNIGGGRHSNCSILEAFATAERITGAKANYQVSEVNRIGDHIWYISDIKKLMDHYPGWRLSYSTDRIITEIADEFERRLAV